MGRYIRGRVHEDIGLTTLAAATLVGVPFDSTVNERTYVSSLVGIWTLTQLTPATDVGPIMVGVAHGDYTDAEVEAFVELAGSWNEGNLTAQEIGQRRIRVVGIFKQPASATQAMTLNEGRSIRTKLGWILLQGQTLRLWAYNLGTQPVATTVPDLDLEGHVNLWPR